MKLRFILFLIFFPIIALACMPIKEINSENISQANFTNVSNYGNFSIENESFSNETFIKIIVLKNPGTINEFLRTLNFSHDDFQVISADTSGVAIRAKISKRAIYELEKHPNVSIIYDVRIGTINT